MARHLLSWHFIYPVQSGSFLLFPLPCGYSIAPDSLVQSTGNFLCTPAAAAAEGTFGRNENAKNISPR